METRQTFQLTPNFKIVMVFPKPLELWWVFWKPHRFSGASQASRSWWVFWPKPLSQMDLATKNVMVLKNRRNLTSQIHLAGKTHHNLTSQIHLARKACQNLASQIFLPRKTSNPTALHLEYLSVAKLVWHKGLATALLLTCVGSVRTPQLPTKTKAEGPGFGAGCA